MKHMMHNEPLLYIEQPKIKRPESYMQVEFKLEQKDTEQMGKDDRHNGIRTSKLKDSNLQVKENKMIPFKRLSLIEKINYLNEIPTDYFQMKCKFTTKDNTYYGMLTEKDEMTIHIIHSGRQKVKVAITDLVDISLIGL